MFELLLPLYVSAVCHPSLIYPTHRAFHGLSREHWDYLNQSCSVAAGEVQERYPGSNNRHDWAAEFKHQSSQWLNLFKTFRRSWRSVLCDNEIHYRDIGTAPELQHHAPSLYGVPFSGLLQCNFVCNGGWTEIILQSPHSFAESIISRLSFKHIPFTVESIDLAEYHPRRFSSEDAIEDAFSRHFLRWTPPRMVERKDGSRIHFRLVEGVFGFGGPEHHRFGDAQAYHSHRTILTLRESSLSLEVLSANDLDHSKATPP
ncbi:hypothetical protein BKA70DRAFT_1409286 [Coprinopsis sp. MPI-PUGE-AT-0042]|nr:hypothetical protein BKA70DRAFT_1409286 [Coprinopsis sp. MPI-PUGE-AT-0042]